MAREIPAGAVEIQTGLYLHEYDLIIGGRTYIKRDLYSSENYCFYDVEQPENYDEEGNLLPEAQRVYAQFSSLGIGASSWTYEQINARYISVPVKDGFEIVSVGNNSETA